MGQAGNEFPRVLISAPKSGSGKTLITCALLRLLQRKGYAPAAYKCGPDYIDPMFHKTVLGMPSRNLDIFLMGRKGVNSSLHAGSEGKNIGVIEGVMGFYDGISASSAEGSSYDLCMLTDTPAILVVDCKGMSRSIAALIKGFTQYDPDGKAKENRHPVKGIILNRVSGMVKDEISAIIKDETGIPVIGSLPALKDIQLESRHLGLVMPSEIPEILSVIDRVAASLEENFDTDAFLEIARGAGASETDNNIYKTCEKHKVRIGIAMDEAFCFYYEDNLDLLKEMGAELIPFSPIHDERIPEVSGLIFGGGYPELHAGALSENITMLESIKSAARSGMPMLAECGGFLYLKQRLKDTDGNAYPMTGILPGEGFMTEKLTHFGYVNVKADEDNPYLSSDECIRGHEFHYYDTTDNGEVCTVSKPTGKRAWKGFQVKQNVFGGFAHLYYPSCPEFAVQFVRKVREVL